MPSVASLAVVFAPIPQIATGRLTEPGRDLRLQLVVPDTDRAVELGGRLDIGGEAARESLGIGSLDTDERLVPAQHLHGLAGVPQHGHHLSGDRVVGVGVHRQEHAVGAALGRGAQRLAGVHAELARLVGGGAHHAALGGIAVAAHHDRLAEQFRVAKHLDGRDELIEVHMQHPPAHARSLTRFGAAGLAAGPESHSGAPTRREERPNG